MILSSPLIRHLHFAVLAHIFVDPHFLVSGTRCRGWHFSSEIHPQPSLSVGVVLLTSAQTETFSQFVSSVKFVFVAEIMSQSFDFVNKCNHRRRAQGVLLGRRPEGGDHSACSETELFAVVF